MPIPDSMRGGWRVEADFIAAIRGERRVTRTDFLTGVRYMQFTEAVARVRAIRSLSRCLSESSPIQVCKCVCVTNSVPQSLTEQRTSCTRA